MLIEILKWILSENNKYNVAAVQIFHNFEIACILVFNISTLLYSINSRQTNNYRSQM